MKASITKSILFSFVAALIPGFAHAIEFKAPPIPTVHVQIPHTPRVNAKIITPQWKGINQQRQITPGFTTRAVTGPAPGGGGGGPSNSSANINSNSAAGVVIGGAGPSSYSGTTQLDSKSLSNINSNSNAGVVIGGANYRQGGTQSPVMKLPARTKYDSITVNRGVTSNQSFQQWQQGVSGGGGASVSGGAATKCYGC